MKGVGIVAVVLSALLLVGCSSEPQGSNADPDLIDAVEQPEVGVCRVLSPADVQQSANATATVDCSQRHTAETFHVAGLPEKFDELEYDDPAVGEFAFRHCGRNYRKFTGADASRALRTTLSWVWFRPSQRAWDDGARWIRCDVIGGHATSDVYRRLPATTKGMLAGRPKDQWLICAAGEVFDEGVAKVPCSRPHDWRAVTTIKVGEPNEPYPGDDVVAQQTDMFCKSSVHAWLNYPEDYDWASTWFGETEWKAGNRLSVCWARTSK